MEDQDYSLLFDLINQSNDNESDMVSSKEVNSVIEHKTNIPTNTEIEEQENKVQDEQDETLLEVQDNVLVIDETSESVDMQTTYDNLFTIDTNLPNVGELENEILSNMIPTTVTVKATLSNIYFNEKDLIKRILPDNNIKAIISNYGELYHDSYIKKNKTKRSNRGRKKIEKEPNRRKPQGTGKAFNSQTSLEIACGDSVYPIKVFRNGNLQFPGSSRERFHDMMHCFQIIIDKFNEILYQGRPLIKLIKVEPVMKNYKYIVKLKPDEILYLEEMRNSLEKERNTSEIPVCQIKYGRDQSKVKIVFDTPLLNKTKKKLTINIFRSGKINVLGGMNELHTLQSYNFIKKVIKKYYKNIIYDPSSFETTDEYEYIVIDNWHTSEQGRINKRNALYTKMGYWVRTITT